MLRDMRLRRATLDDLGLLRDWDTQPHLITAKGGDDWHWGTALLRDPAWREQLIAEVDHHPVGFVQIIDPAREDSHYWGEIGRGLRAIDIWIGTEKDLGKGLGTEMMQLALARCFSHGGVSAVLVDPLASNTRAHRLYERLEFECAEPRRFGRDDCFVFRLSRDNYECLHCS